MVLWFAALLVGPAVLVPLGVYCVGQPRVKGARWYGGLLLTIAWWSLAYAWELSAHDPATKVLALKVKYFGVVALPPAWIGFILEFVGSEPRRLRSRIVPLWIVATIALGLIWTDQWHGLFWGPMRVQDIGGYFVLQGRGPGFWVNVAYSYVVLAAGLVLLALHTVDSPYLYRTRAGILLVGTIVPWAGNFIFMLHRQETIFDPTPSLFTCTAIVAALAVFRYELLEPVPTLRDARIASVGDPVIILDARRRIADLNAAATRVLGWPRAEAAGTVIDDALPQWPCGVLPEGPMDLSLRVRDEIRIFDTRCSQVRSRAGHASGAIVILRDVTERRAAEAALRESEQRYRAVIEQAFDGVWLTDWTGTVTDVNPKACELLECSRQEVIGARPFGCVGVTHHHDTPPAETALRRGDLVAWEQEFETRSGRRVVVAGRSKQIGADVVVSTFRDITEERAQAQGRERLLHEAQAANRLKDEFLATVSHELRTPLNAVMGWTHMLARHEMDGARVAHALEVIERNTRAQARLVEDLVDLSGLAGGRMRLSVRPSSISVLVGETLEAVAPSADAKSVSLHAAIAPDLPEILVDPDRLEQVIWNLLTNAIKFTPPGGHVTLSASAASDELCLSVADTGVGIAREFLPHVFDPFRQAEGVESRRPRGLGLGLAIVKRIVEAHGGRVEAESAGPDCGAMFTIHLPMKARAGVPDSAGAR